MDTVTRAPMAIVWRKRAGIGIIDRGYRPGEIEPQVREVQAVKRSSTASSRPYTIQRTSHWRKPLRRWSSRGVGTLVVLDGDGRLAGLLTERDIRFVADSTIRVSERMTPRARLVLHTGAIELPLAERIMVERKIKKLPLVDRDGTAARSRHLT